MIDEWEIKYLKFRVYIEVRKIGFKIEICSFVKNKTRQTTGFNFSTKFPLKVKPQGEKM